MSAPEFDEMSSGQRPKSDASQTQLSFVAEAFLELFKLLERNAPVWYTEEHHKKAAAASNDCHRDLLSTLIPSSCILQPARQRRGEETWAIREKVRISYGECSR